MAEVVPFFVGEQFFEVAALAFAEEIGDGFFSGVSEGRIAQIIRQATGADDGADFFKKFGIVYLYPFLHKELPELIAQ